MRLHGEVGPARTTISGIAKEAGVQRATVYRHFPDEKALFDACTAHYWSANPRPDIEGWRRIEDPALRLRHALDELYSLFARTEPMLEKTSRDAPLVPAMAKASREFRDYLGAATDAIVAGRSERGAARRRVRAAIGHAVSFPAWRSLVREQGLEPAEAATVMAAMVEGAGAVAPAGGVSPAKGRSRRSPARSR